jgi:hypothetical protein
MVVTPSSSPAAMIACLFAPMRAVALSLLAAVFSAPASAALTPPAELRFADFFEMPIGARGVAIKPALLALDGQRVQITGYMVRQEQAMAGHFFLTPRPVSMSEHADGDADDLPPTTVLVVMPAPDERVEPLPTRGLLRLTGALKVGRHEMADGRVVWVRLLLEPRAAP